MSKKQNKKHVPIEEVETILKNNTFTDGDLNEKLGAQTQFGIKNCRNNELEPYIILMSNTISKWSDGQNDLIDKIINGKYPNFTSDDGKLIFYFKSNKKSNNESGSSTEYTSNETKDTGNNGELEKTLKDNRPIFLLQAVEDGANVFGFYSKVKLIEECLEVDPSTGTGIFPLMSVDDYEESLRCGTLDEYRTEAEWYASKLGNLLKVNENDGATMGENFIAYLKVKGLVYDGNLIKRFICSIGSRPFVILSGGSGCGKTRLAIEYAKWVTGNDHDRYEVVAVGSNWNENRHLMGYYNIIKDEYVETPAFKLLERASKHPSEKHVLILDEMNLSKVEHYFSDFLSSMESDEPMKLSPPTTGIPNGISLGVGDNVIVIGTVNIDETTDMFSPKVLDRAFVIDFDKTNIGVALGEAPDVDNETSEMTMIDDVNITSLRSMSSKDLVQKMRSDGLNPDGLITAIKRISEIMDKMGLPFGYRTLDDVFRFVTMWQMSNKDRDSDLMESLDWAVVEKILPKIHGGLSIRNQLDELGRLCKDNDLTRSAERLSKMSYKLSNDGFVSFLN